MDKGEVYKDGPPPGVEGLRVTFNAPINQDAVTMNLLLVTKDEGEGRRQFQGVVRWEEYRQFDVMDVSTTTFVGTIKVEVLDYTAPAEWKKLW